MTATYSSTESIGGWAQVAGGNNTVLNKVRRGGHHPPTYPQHPPTHPPTTHQQKKVRTVQAFSIIGGITKIISTTTFLSGRFAARTASQALVLLDKGRWLNLGFLFCNLLVTSIWASLPENAFFFYCNVYPQQEGQRSCISTHFMPPLGNSTFQGRSYSYDLVVAATGNLPNHLPILYTSQ